MSRADGNTSEAVASFLYEETLSSAEQNALRGRLDAASSTDLREVSFGGVAAVLAKAATQKVRILMGGTSISTFDTAVNRVFAAHLRNLYGGPVRHTVHRLGVIGGSWELPYLGWKKQFYGGPSFRRLRGESSSTALPTEFIGTSVTIEYSKEADGGSCSVEIDGVAVGTINCNGAQEYSLKATFAVDLGFHTLTIQPPASGYIYLERIHVERGNTGIEIIDGTLGGSSLSNTHTVQTVNGLESIPIVSDNGLRAYFGRSDIDLVIWSGPVNDTNSAAFIADLDLAVEMSRQAGCYLILIVEMLGHFSMPNAEYGSHPHRIAMRDHMLKVGRENSHVFTCDWHGQTMMDPDYELYAARYYHVTDLDVEAGTFAGDFIHPDGDAYRIGVGMLCSATGVPPPAYYTVPELDAKNSKKPPVPAGTPVAVVENGVSRLLPSAEVGALTADADYSMPLVLSSEIRDAATFAEEIAASVTSDQYGKYIDYDNQAVYLSSQVEEETVTLTVLARRAVGFVEIKPGSAALSHGGENVSVVRFGGVLPAWASVEVTVGSGDFLVLSGRFYAMAVTRTGGQPVAMAALSSGFRGVGPDQILLTDIAYDQALVGQGFYLATSEMEKTRTLVGYCWKWNFATGGFERKGLYRVWDRTEAGYLSGVVNSITGTAASAYFGGSGHLSNANPKYVSFYPVANSAAGKMTVVFKAGALTGDRSVKLQWFNGGNNGTRYVSADGSLSETQVNVFAGAEINSLLGETLAITVDLPYGEAILGTTPELRVRISSAVYGAVTLAPGELAII